MVETTETTRKLEPIWRCQAKDCNTVYPPTLHGYNQMGGHQLHHAKEGLTKEERVFRLIDKNTGEVLAETLKEAMEKGLLEPPRAELPKEKPKAMPTPPPGVKLPVEPPKAEPPEVELAEKAPKAEITIKTPGVFTYEMTLPADAFTLFNLAKTTGLEPNEEKLFEEWVWDCIRARYSKDYKQQLVLAPLEE